MKKLANNYAFIDSQNLNLRLRDLGWKLNYQKFRIYLKEKYAVTRALLFIGFVSTNEDLYKHLQNSGFELVFKTVIPDPGGKIKGNIDADLVLHVMIELENYEKAVIVSSDGDFSSLVRFLYRKNKLEIVLSSDFKNCSNLLKQDAREKIHFIAEQREKLEYVPVKREP